MERSLWRREETASVITYQSPLPALRPLSPPSVEVFPTAAEAKLEVNGEGIIVVWRWYLLD